MSYIQRYNPGDSYFVAAIDKFTGAGNGTIIAVTDSGVSFQVSGTATSVIAGLQLSLVDPGPDGALGNWALADEVTGNPSSGINVRTYRRTEHGWWRASVAAVTGGTVTTSVSGKVSKT